ncbi:MAG TPA: UDP-2,3-diacylglucosamine diphosphatase, partial [Steroidobacteraceae bacterium]|nr:UDP-2,3-diacylglucosamine diphosphatase [Steroidobacteraceae bacterium]
MSRLFVSDVHLDASAPQATEQFVSFLRNFAAKSEALYILGDLFEVWVGDDDPDAEKARVVTALHELTRSGVACFVIHGNRDFLLGRDFCDRSGVRLLQDPAIVELDGERVLVTHGDALCTDDHSYQELRSTVRTVGWQRRFLSLPFSVRDRFANRARAGSKAHTARTPPKIQDVNAAA